MGMPGKGKGDSKQTIFNVMKEMSKSNKLIHKNDLWTMVMNQMDKYNFEEGVSKLEEDGMIFPAIGDDVYSLN